MLQHKIDASQHEHLFGMRPYQVRTTTRKREVRAYGDRPARVEKEQEHRLAVSRREEVIERAKHALIYKPAR